jgi:hypothetical protein
MKNVNYVAQLKDKTGALYTYNGKDVVGVKGNNHQHYHHIQDADVQTNVKC